MKEPKNFVRILTEYLVAEDKEIDFDIYTFRAKNDKPILLIPASTNVGTIRDQLAQKKHGPLYITREAYSRFEKFMEESLDFIIKNPAIPLEKKSSVIYGCARNIIKDVFDDPRSGKNISRAQSVTNNIIKFSLADRSSIPSLLKLGSHDYYTFSHCVNVAVFAIGLWMVIGKGGERELTDFALGCILHDVGKCEITEAILNKPGKLDDREFEIIKNHPAQGVQLMTGHCSEVTLDIIMHHHEKVDGRGYPHALRGDQISDNAKIATIADVYDALTTNRPYAGARLPFSALSLMKKEMVGHFEQEKFNEFILFLGGKMY